MRRVFSSCVRGVAGVAVILALAGSAFGATRDQGRDRDHERQGVVKMIKRVVRALGDGLVVPLPKPTNP